MKVPKTIEECANYAELDAFHAARKRRRQPLAVGILLGFLGAGAILAANGFPHLLTLQVGCSVMFAVGWAIAVLL